MKALRYLAGLVLLGWLSWWIVPAAQLPYASSPFVDAHVHTAGLGYGDSGAFINAQMRDSYKFPVYLWAIGVNEEELKANGDGYVIDQIAASIRQSQRVRTAVILAMDGVIDSHGQLDRDLTQIYVPNEFVAAKTAQHVELEFGASVNPNRPDAIERLRRVHAAGAKLIKWIPNIMHIDPANPAHSAFYQEMAQLGLPLLSHTGQERSFADAIDEYGDPQRLALPLSLGVTVIAAHIATTGTIEEQDNYARILDMFDDYPNLYTEISSLTQVNKLNYLADALSRPSVTARMLYGTDWPLQFFPLVSPIYHLNHISVRQAKAVSQQSNQWDADVVLKQYLGVPNEVFERSSTLLDL